MNKSKLNQCIICFFAFLIIAILIYKIITIEKFQTSTSTSQSTTNEVNYSPDNNQFGVNGIKKINLTQPGVYVIARPDETIDLSAINEVDTYDYIIKLRNRAENNDYDLTIFDNIIIKSDGITIIGNSTITEENPIEVPDRWAGLIVNNNDGEYGFSNLVFKNIHIKCVIKDFSLPEYSCSRSDYSKFGSLVAMDPDGFINSYGAKNHFSNGGIFKYDFGWYSTNLVFENLSFQGNIGAAIFYDKQIDETTNEYTNCFKTYKLYNPEREIIGMKCGGIFGSYALCNINDLTINNLKYKGNIYGKSCGGIFGYCNLFIEDYADADYTPNIQISNLYSEAKIYGMRCGGIFGPFCIHDFGPNKSIQLSDCYFVGEIFGVTNSGIFGDTSIYNSHIDLINCHSKCNLNTIELPEKKKKGRTLFLDFVDSGYQNSGIISTDCVKDNSILNILNCSFEGTICGKDCAGIISTNCSDDSSNINIINTFCKGSFEFELCKYEDIFINSNINKFKIKNNDFAKIYDYYSSQRVGVYETFLPGINNSAFCANNCKNVKISGCYSDFKSNINKTYIELDYISYKKKIYFANSSFINVGHNIVINNCFVLTNLNSNNTIFAFHYGKGTNISINNSCFNSNSSNIITSENAFNLKAISDITYGKSSNFDTDISQFSFNNVYSFNNMNEFNKIAERTIYVGVPKDTWYICSPPWKLMWEAQRDYEAVVISSTNLVLDNSVTLPSLENCEALGLNIRCSSTQN